MNRKHKELVGSKFERLLILQYFVKNNRTYFLCKCDCGNIKEIRSASITNKRTKSCGCIQKEQLANDFKGKVLSYGESSFNALYKNYQSEAIRRGLCWEIDKDYFRDLTKNNCYYCGIEPNTRIHKKTIYKGKLYYGNGEYIYNGIDRIDNKLGYTIDNCVPACKICNRAKHSLTLEEFYTWVNRIKKYVI